MTTLIKLATNSSVLKILSQRRLSNNYRIEPKKKSREKSARLSKLNSSCPEEQFGFQKKREHVDSDLANPGENVYIPRERFSFRDILRRKITKKPIETRIISALQFCLR